MNNRVVITGLGVLTANADNLDSFTEALKQGRPGIRNVTLFDVSKFKFQKAGEITDFKSERYSHLDRVSQLTLEAAKMAVEDSRLTINSENRERMGVVMGTTMGGVLSLERLQYLLEKNEISKITPTLLQEYSFHIMADHIAEEYNIKGPKATISTACASGANSIGYAADFIRYGKGKTDIMISGGADALSQFVFSGFSSLRAITKSMNRPFDKNRDGLVLGEGAGILILEKLEHALKRKANIYAEIIGYGISNDATHPTTPDKEGKGVRRTIKFALNDAKIGIKDIDYINAHGTGTKANDVMECNAIKKVFGKDAYNIPVSSIKPMIGHTLGAAGSIEIIASILSIKKGFIPPTLNYETLDPDCDLDVVPNKSREMKVDTVLSLSSGFAGNNAAVIVRKYGG